MKYITSLIFLFSLLFLLSTPIYACQEKIGKHYELNVVIYEKNLPEGIQIYVPACVGSSGGIGNSSITPLYLGRIDSPAYLLDRKYFGLPKGVYPWYKLVSDEVYDFYTKDTKTESTWHKEYNFNFIELDELRLQKLDVDIEGVGKVKINSGMKDLFEPKIFQLKAYYGNKPLTIEGELFYSIEDFSNEAPTKKGNRLSAFIYSIQVYIHYIVSKLRSPW